MMSPPYHFAVRYDERLVREAAWCFVKRRFSGNRSLWIAAAFLLAWSIACAWWFSDPRWIVFALALPIVLVTLFLAAWLAHLRAAFARLRALDAMHATFRFDEAGLSVTSKAGSTTLVWAALGEVWAYRHFWIVTQAENAYFTLPIDTAPAEALVFARTKLAERIR